MPDTPRLPLIPTCPDLLCAVPIGTKHGRECLTAICITTGQQRALHQDDPDAAITGCFDIHPGTPVTGGAVLCEKGCGIPVWRHGAAHLCGQDVWTGWPHGAIEAAEYGLFVREATTADQPLTGWIPCQPTDPGAVPDLDRLVRSGTWNSVRQVFVLAGGSHA